MAQMNGVQIKSLKSFEGWEGTTFQGTVYIDGKKQGFWSQDSHGAICDDFDFDTTELKKKATEWYTKHPEVDTAKLSKVDIKDIDFDNLPTKMPGDLILETFMSDLVDLAEDEKEFKKAIKKGYKGYGIIDAHDIENMPTPLPTGWYLVNKSDLDKILNEKREKYPNCYAIGYFSEKDFQKV